MASMRDIVFGGKTLFEVLPEAANYEDAQALAGLDLAATWIDWMKADADWRLLGVPFPQDLDTPNFHRGEN